MQNAHNSNSQGLPPAVTEWIGAVQGKGGTVSVADGAERTVYNATRPAQMPGQGRPVIGLSLAPNGSLYSVRYHDEDEKAVVLIDRDRNGSFQQLEEGEDPVATPTQWMRFQPNWHVGYKKARRWADLTAEERLRLNARRGAAEKVFRSVAAALEAPAPAAASPAPSRESGYFPVAGAPSPAPTPAPARRLDVPPVEAAKSQEEEFPLSRAFALADGRRSPTAKPAAKTV